MSAVNVNVLKLSGWRLYVYSFQRIFKAPDEQARELTRLMGLDYKKARGAMRRERSVAQHPSTRRGSKSDWKIDGHRSSNKSQRETSPSESIRGRDKHANGKECTTERTAKRQSKHRKSIR